MTDADSQDPSIGHPRSSKHTALTRRTARLNAVQALYQMEITGQGLDYVIETFTHQGSLGELDGQTTVWDPAMFRTLLTAAVHHQTETDRLTGSVLRQDWTLASIDPTLRAIFRAAGAELHNPERTPRIVIRDYLDITSAFFPRGKEIGLVNGVLDTLARQLRPDAFGPHPA